MLGFGTQVCPLCQPSVPALLPASQNRSGAPGPQPGRRWGHFHGGCEGGPGAADMTAGGTLDPVVLDGEVLGRDKVKIGIHLDNLDGVCGGLNIRW
jgi:hypothetical protein